jgi:hypothetical protein
MYKIFHNPSFSERGCSIKSQKKLFFNVKMETVKMKEHLLLGKWTEDKIDRLLIEASKIYDIGHRIDFLSRQFLDTKYQESTLIGDVNTLEVFVINLEGVDCFTFLDYIEAMRLSKSFSEFKGNLRQVRYRSGEISFENRHHFFTDWKSFNSHLIVDVTRYLGAEKSKDVSKRLNEKLDGTFFLPGVSCRLREVTYIQSIYVDDMVLEKLETGDYVGIYSKIEGLDVSHVGIIIKEQGAVNFRHASSAKKHMKVIDEDLKNYLNSKHGIVVLRPRD